VNKVTVPVNAMLFRSEGPQVAVVGSDNKVQLRRITIGRDYGTILEILGGVASGDRVIINPPDSLEDGQQVNVAQPTQNQQKPGQPASQEQPPAEKQKAEKPKTEKPKNDRQKGSGQ
jgi:hypothetical protein